jgi:hypothetical protein
MAAEAQTGKVKCAWYQNARLYIETSSPWLRVVDEYEDTNVTLKPPQGSNPAFQSKSSQRSGHLKLAAGLRCQLDLGGNVT